MKIPIRLLSAVFLAAMLWQMIGFLCYFEWQHTLVKKSVKQLLKNSVPENQLITFAFNGFEIQQLTWVKSHEFKINGRFYDVLQRKIIDGKTYLKCIDDQQETQLFKRLDESTALNLWGGSKDHALNELMHLLQTPFLPLHSFDMQIAASNFSSAEHDFSYPNKSLSDFHRSFYTPPKRA